ncbi:4a-hydroxytetrahydrobiopterin dehydratase [Aquirufa sp. ROCK2-A2]
MYKINQWKLVDHALIKTFEFASFEQALLFMQSAVPFINETDHHPNWTNVYNKVHVKLNTHDAGNVVTEKDWVLARFLDEIYIKQN